MSVDRKIPSPATGVSAFGEGEFADAVHEEVAALWALAPVLLGSVAGTANAITAAATPPFLALSAGNRVVLVPTAANTGAVTLDVDGLGVKDVRDRAAAALAAGALAAGTAYDLYYTGAHWRVLGALSNVITADAGPDILARDVKTSGANGGTATAGSWVKRALGGATLARNVIAGASMSSDEITLPAGTWAARWSAPALGVNLHQSRLYNVTDAAVIAVGSTEYSISSQYATSRSGGEVVFALAASKVLRLEHRVQTTLANVGLGLAAGFGEELYSWLALKRIA